MPENDYYLTDKLQMKNFVFILLVLFLSVSCKKELVKEPAKLIEKEKMIDIIYDLSIRSGLKAEDINVKEVEGYLPGFVITDNNSARYYLELIQKISAFDVTTINGKVNFKMRKYGNEYHISQEDLLLIDNEIGLSLNKEYSLQEELHVLIDLP